MQIVVSFLFLSLVSILVFDNAFADLWKVQIPPDAYDVDSSTHFIPKEISIKMGDTVEWGNTDGKYHTITSGSLETGIDGIFDSGYLKSGAKFKQAFSEVGEFKYFCTIHPWMTGIINVLDLPEGFQIFHNVGDGVSDITFDITYKVQRNLSSVNIDDARDMIIFDFVGKIDNDEFAVYLPQELIQDPQSVWIDNTQIMDFIKESSKNGVTLSIPLEGHTTQVRIVGTDVIGEFSQKPYVLVNQIFAITDKQTYNPVDVITISGEIKNRNQLSKITTEITSPNSVVLYSEDVMVTGPRFTVDVNTDVLTAFGQYKIDFKGKDIHSSPIYFDYEFQAPPSPKKQMDSGIRAGDVMCKNELELFMKTSNGNAVCLTESTATILTHRGIVDYF